MASSSEMPRTTAATIALPGIEGHAEDPHRADASRPRAAPSAPSPAGRAAASAGTASRGSPPRPTPGGSSSAGSTGSPRACRAPADRAREREGPARRKRLRGAPFRRPPRGRASRSCGGFAVSTREAEASGRRRRSEVGHGAARLSGEEVEQQAVAPRRRRRTLEARIVAGEQAVREGERIDERAHAGDVGQRREARRGAARRRRGSRAPRRPRRPAARAPPRGCRGRGSAPDEAYPLHHAAVLAVEVLEGRVDAEPHHAGAADRGHEDRRRRAPTPRGAGVRAREPQQQGLEGAGRAVLRRRAAAGSAAAPRGAP